MPSQRLGEIMAEMRAAAEGLGAALNLTGVPEQARQWLESLADRFQHADGPLLVAVCGPTGAGKSHLVNFLAGAPVSPSSYRRPSTIAPVLVGPESQLAKLRTGSGFLPSYAQVAAPGGAIFAEGAAGHQLYLTPLERPAWPWPEDLVLVDTPDFDSVRLANQAQALDLARRADAVILVTHQAKYADQSAWDFLAAEKGEGRPLLLILNRITAAAARDDFQARLAAAGLTAPVIAWPEESSAAQVGLNVVRRELTAWLEDLGRQSRPLVHAGGRRALGRLQRLWHEELAPPLARRRAALEREAAAVARVAREWETSPRDRVSLSLPGETREQLMKSLGEVVRRSDLWDKPRRFLTRPLAAAGGKIKRMFGMAEKPGEAEKKLAAGLAEAGREALVTAVRDQARALAEAADLPSPQVDLDLSPEEIRARHQELSQRLEAWLKEATGRLLAGLPLGQKAAFYFVQFMHLGLVAGLWFQAGGAPGAEVLVGGALGPVISKLTGAVISREKLADFEEQAAGRHQRELAAVFQEQSRRYEQYVAQEQDRLSAGRIWQEGLKRLEEEAGRLWA